MGIYFSYIDKTQNIRIIGKINGHTKRKLGVKKYHGLANIK